MQEPNKVKSIFKGEVPIGDLINKGKKILSSTTNNQNPSIPESIFASVGQAGIDDIKTANSTMAKAPKEVSTKFGVIELGQKLFKDSQKAQEEIANVPARLGFKAINKREPTEEELAKIPKLDVTGFAGGMENVAGKVLGKSASAIKNVPNVTKGLTGMEQEAIPYVQRQYYHGISGSRLKQFLKTGKIPKAQQAFGGEFSITDDYDIARGHAGDKGIVIPVKISKNAEVGSSSMEEGLLHDVSDIGESEFLVGGNYAVELPKIGKKSASVLSGSKDLLQEAKKYKSAEEFVKAQGKPLYHGTSEKSFKLDTKKPLFTTNSFDSANTYAGYSYNTKPTGKVLEFIAKKGKSLDLNNTEVAKDVYKNMLGSKKLQKAYNDIPNQYEVFNDYRDEYEILRPRSNVGDLTTWIGLEFGDSVPVRNGVKVKTGSYSFGDKGKEAYSLYRDAYKVYGNPTRQDIYTDWDKIIKYAKEKKYDFIKHTTEDPSAEIVFPETVVLNPGKSLYTKSQLTDIFNKAHSNVNPLLSEAKKYKSAEEFVNAQPNQISGEFYRYETTGTEGNKVKFYSDKMDYVDEYKYVREQNGGTGKIIKEKIDLKNPLIIKTKSNEFSDPSFEKQFIDKALKNGNDGVVFKSPDGDIFVAKLPKSQLTDIWEKANKSGSSDLSGKASLGTIFKGAAASIGGLGLTTLFNKGNTVEYKAEEKKAVPTDKLREAIGMSETSIIPEEKRYSYNKPSGIKLFGRDLGKYQVTDAELKTYAKRYLGRNVTSDEFLKNPKLQDEYMDNKIKYLREQGYTDAEIAAIHRGGINTDLNSTRSKKYSEITLKHLDKLNGK